MNTSPITSFTIHTMGGPIRRHFSSLALAKQWARLEWTFPKTLEDHLKQGAHARDKRERASLQKSIDEKNARHFERHKSGVIVFVAGDEGDGPFSCGIQHEGDERIFATIGERQHCAECGHVIATRSDFKGEWSTRRGDEHYWPKDLESDDDCMRRIARIERIARGVP